MKKILLILLFFIYVSSKLEAQDHCYDPPWNAPPKSAVMFTVPGVNNIPDLYVDINDPELVIFFAGNQFMCIDSLITSFKRQYPQYKRIFVETLPPGILAKQIEGGSLTVGNLRITLRPDIYTAGKSQIEQMIQYLTDTATYAFNKLAIMVRKGNQKNILSLRDLGKSNVRVSMPNPAWEGIGILIEAAYMKAGGSELKHSIMVDKVRDSTTYLTRMHHRESPMRLLYNQSDAAPVWHSEVWYQQMIDHPVELVSIPENENVHGRYVAGILKNAPHAAAAKDFMQFLQSDEAKNIYKKYGFSTK
jgi:molybdate transport system substrate-binding protein